MPGYAALMLERMLCCLCYAIFMPRRLPLSLRAIITFITLVHVIFSSLPFIYYHSDAYYATLSLRLPPVAVAAPLFSLPLMTLMMLAIV